ncbi:hypothetical protein DEFDS_P050 (plasmid) [Deferribacter desulfuricans SSM1]|uniref:Uncharacterized protein n=1 Tax=Deferribacter desulfuricans (strain DSM 14783 / JCM 11476 / NBRC 101012 / SSM1) TaxID=639282 RepID=D3PEN2_DEFDS|nr:hypothetical protein [Deferribacter desulfuricans]BAI81674.1 hypothetical protein DEFDS_P050 [Deferribacter desulfuricans SSM1]
MLSFEFTIPIHIYDNWFGFLYTFSLALCETIYKYLTGGYSAITIATISFFLAFLNPYLRYITNFSVVFGKDAVGIKEYVDTVIKRDFYMKIFISGILLALLLAPVKIQLVTNNSLLVPKEVFQKYIQSLDINEFDKYIDTSDNEFQLPVIIGLAVSIVDTAFKAVTGTLTSLTGTTDFTNLNVDIIQKFMDSWDLKDAEDSIPNKMVSHLYTLKVDPPKSYVVDVKANEDVNNLDYSLALYSIVLKSLYGMEYKGSIDYLSSTDNKLYLEFINNLMRIFSGKEKKFNSYLNSGDPNIDIKIKYNTANNMFNEGYQTVSSLENFLLTHPEVTKALTLMLSWYKVKYSTLGISYNWALASQKKIYDFNNLKAVIKTFDKDLDNKKLHRIVEFIFTSSSSPYQKLQDLLEDGDKIPVNTFTDSATAYEYYNTLEKVLKYQRDELQDVLVIMDNYRRLYLGIMYALDNNIDMLDNLINTTKDSTVKEVLKYIKTNKNLAKLVRSEESNYIKRVALFYTNLYTKVNGFLNSINFNLSNIESVKSLYEKILAEANAEGVDVKTVLKDRKEDFVLFRLLNIPVNTVNEEVKEPGIKDKFLSKAGLITKEGFIYALVVLFFYIFCIFTIFLFIMYLIQRFIAFVLYFILSPLYFIKAIVTQTFNQTLTAYFASWINFRAFDFGLLIGFIFLKLVIKIVNTFSLYLVYIYQSNLLGIKLAFMSILVLSMFICIQVMKFIYLKITRIVNNKFDVVAESLAKVSDMALGQAMALASAGVGLAKTASSLGFKGLGGLINTVAPGVGSIVSKAGSAASGAAGEVGKQAVDAAQKLNNENNN